MTVAARLEAISRQIGALRPDWRNPERYFEQRSEIQHEVRRIVKQLEER